MSLSPRIRRGIGAAWVAGVLIAAGSGTGSAAPPVREVPPVADLVQSAEGLPRGTVTSVDACTEFSSGDCTPVVAAGAGMAVPLLRPWLRGTDGGWWQLTMCCASSNYAQRPTISGLLGGWPAAVVPQANTGIGTDAVDASGASTYTYAGSGGTYRLIRVRSKVGREAEDAAQPATTPYTWTVASDVFTYTCRQRAATRDPLRDCGTGTQQYTRGRLVTPNSTLTSAFRVVVPIDYFVRSVDNKGRPLTTPRTSTGHWTLTATPSYHGWLWTTEWNVNGVGFGRVAGSAFRSGQQIVLTDGPFA